MTKELKDALHNLIDACVEFKEHGYDVFIDYSPHCTSKCELGCFDIYYYDDGKWHTENDKKEYHAVVNTTVYCELDSLNRALVKMKELAASFGFELGV